MTIRRVEIDVTAHADEAKAELDDLKRIKDELEKPGNIRLGINLGDMSKLDRLKITLEELGTKVAKPSVEIQGISGALASTMLLNRELDRLNGRKIRADILGGGAGTAAIDRALGVGRGGTQTVVVQHGLMEKLGILREILPHSLPGHLYRAFQLHRLGEVFNAERGLGGLLKRWAARDVAHLGGGDLHLASDAGAAGQGGGGILSGIAGVLPNQARGALIGGGIGLAAAMLPGLLGLGIGGLVGAGGLYGAYTLDPKAFAKVKKSLSNAFLSALTSRPQGIGSGFGQTGKMGPFGTGGESFLGGIKAMLGQVNSFIQKIAPELGGMFRASLPILDMFIRSMETLVKLLLPSFLVLMNAIKPELPLFQQGFKLLAQGIADFLKNLGPGMKSSGIIFKAVMEAIKGVLIGASYAIVGFEKFLVWLGERIKFQAHEWRVTFDDFRHRTAVIFDGARHEVAHIWDMMWQDTIGTMIRALARWKTLSDGWGHDIVHWLDDARHWFASGWDLIWNNTAGRLQRGIQDAENLFGGWAKNIRNWLSDALHTIVRGWETIWSGIWGQIRHWPQWVWNLGKDVISGLWHGMLSVWHDVEHWISSLGGWIKAHKGPLSLDSQLLVPAGKALMSGLHTGLLQGFLGGPASFITSLAGTIGGLLSKGIASLFKGGGASGGIAKVVETVLAITHSPPGWLGPLIRLVNFESGGRPTIVNPISVGGQHATGFWQMLPSTFAAYSRGGSIDNPIAEGIAALAYIKQRYGSPFNIPGLMSGSYHGYWGGGWVNEPVVGFGMHSGAGYSFAEHGREYVTPGGTQPGAVYNIYTLDPSYSDEKALQQIKTLRRYRQRHGYVPLGFE